METIRDEVLKGGEAERKEKRRDQRKENYRERGEIRKSVKVQRRNKNKTE